MAHPPAAADSPVSARLDAALPRFTDFKPGVSFVDVFPLFRQPALAAEVLSVMAAAARALLAPAAAAGRPRAVAGFEARGFLFGVPVAQALGVPFIGLRKAGKLPGPVLTQRYDLEYGSAEIAVSAGAVEPGAAVVLIDDLLATGGTAAAGAELVARAAAGAAAVGLVVAVTIRGLGGDARLAAAGVPAVRSILTT